MPATTTAPTNGTTHLSAVGDLLARLSPEEKYEALVSLARELISFHPTSARLPLRISEDDPVGYLVPQWANDEEVRRMLDSYPPDVRERLTRPVPLDIDLDDVLSDEEMRALTGGRYPRSPE